MPGLGVAALAAAPIVLILGLMLGLQWSAARAGTLALALAAALALTVFDFGAATAAPLLAVTGVAAEGGFLALTILWILWPALALHRMQQASGATDTLRHGLARLTGSTALQALLVGWLMALFFEGAAGFGTPVALAAPLLVGLGLAPVPAVVLALLGHAVGVSFGALGTPVLAQVALTGLDGVQIAWRTALLHAALGGVMMLFFVHTLAASGHRPGWRWAALAAAGFLLPSLALAALLGPELATLGGALVGGALFIAVLRRRAVAGAASAAASGPKPGAAGADAPALARALAPYGVLVVAVVLLAAARLWPPVDQALSGVRIEWQGFGGYGGRMQPLTHPGTLLLAALLIGARLQRVPMRQVGLALAHAARQLLPVTLALLAMLVLSRLMLHAGLIAALEQAAVQLVGPAWPWVAPSVGALGSFVTGSATASNVLFTSLQAQTAQALALPVTAIVAAQGFGAAVGNIVCPHNIVAGAATVGLAGRESEILRRMLLPCAVYLALGGALLSALLLGGVLAER
jgi:lactate permease